MFRILSPGYFGHAIYEVDISCGGEQIIGQTVDVAQHRRVDIFLAAQGEDVSFGSAAYGTGHVRGGSPYMTAG